MKIGRFALFYRWVEYAAFGRALERARFALLDRLGDARRILILGEGDGRIAEKLATRADVDVIELSPEMIALARRRAPQARYRCEDIRTARLGSYDAVIAPFVFDLFDAAELSGIVRKLHAPVLLVVDFAIPVRGWRKLHSQLWLWVMYRFFAVVTGLRTRHLPPVGPLLREHGLRSIAVRENRAGLIRAELWQRPGRAETPEGRSEHAE